MGVLAVRFNVWGRMFRDFIGPSGICVGRPLSPDPPTKAENLRL
jgi:hypothetical protein